MPAPDSDMYGDAPAAAPDNAKPQPEESDDSQIAILPKSFFGGKDIKPGDKCDVTIKAIHSQDVEAEPCEGHDEGGEKPAAEVSEPEAAEGSMRSMMQ